MALPENILTPDDFRGYFEVYKGLNGKIEAYIDRFVPKLMVEFFGKDLAEDIIANRNTTDTSNRCYDLINGFTGIDYFYNGLVDLLTGFVWFEYVGDEKFRQTAAGTAVQKAEVSREPNFDSGFLYTKYNDSVEQLRAMRCFIREHKSKYMDFKGTDRKYIGWI